MAIYDIFLALAVVIIWGLNFCFSKFGLAYFPPFMLMALRFLLVAIILLPFTDKPAMSIKRLVKISLIYGALYHSAVFYGIYLGLNISTTVIINQLNVPLTSIFAVLLLNDTIRWRRILGLIISFTGVIMVIGTPASLDNLQGVICVLISAIAMAYFNVEMKRAGNINIISLLAYSSVISSFVLFGLSFAFEDFNPIYFASTPTSATIAIIYMSIFATIIGFGLWFHLLIKYSVNEVAPFSLLVPVVGVLSSVVIFDEKLNAQIIIGGILTIIGVSIIVLRKPKFLNRGVTTT